MAEFLLPYQCLVASLVALGAVLVVQFVVADVAGIRAKHVPGMPVTTGHSDFHFRATRAQGNTNESLGLFIVLVLAAIFTGADAKWSAIGAWVWVVGRALYMLCYYFDLRPVRSIVFGVGQLGLLVLLVESAWVLLR